MLHPLVKQGIPFGAALWGAFPKQHETGEPQKTRPVVWRNCQLFQGVDVQLQDICRGIWGAKQPPCPRYIRGQPFGV